MQRDDPDKVAQVDLRLSASDRLPAHLLLGSDAVHLASLVSAERAKEDANWKELSVSTNFRVGRDFRDTHRQDAVRKELRNMF
jgi:hypothetical protein